MDGNSVDVRGAMGTRVAILNYLRGEGSLDALLGFIESAGAWEAAQHFIRDLDGYGDPNRRESLSSVLQVLQSDAA